VDPVGALIGAVLLGIGTIVLFGAVRNKKIFGPDGIVSTALTTGSVADLDKVPKAFDMSVTVGPSKTVAKGVGELARKLFGGASERQSVWLIPLTVRQAVFNIGDADTSLAFQISDEIDKMDSQSTRADLAPLAQLLTLAEAKGHKVDADTIRTYVRTLTGESI